MDTMAAGQPGPRSQMPCAAAIAARTIIYYLVVVGIVAARDGRAWTKPGLRAVQAVGQVLAAAGRGLPWSEVGMTAFDD